MDKPRVKLNLDGGYTPLTPAMTAYDAADTSDPHFAGWQPMAGSADSDMDGELDIMVPRARDLVRNNGLASGYVQTSKDNIVGSVLKLSSKPMHRLLGWETDQAHEWARGTEAEFATYAETNECDAARELTLIGLTTQALGSVIFNGEALCVPKWIPRVGNRWSTKLQLIEADRLSTPPHLSANSNIFGGKEQNKNGEVIAYWIRKDHPGDSFMVGSRGQVDDYDRVPAFTPWGRRNVIHLYDAERTGQSRGRSVLTSVMKEFKQAGRYTQEELKGTIVNALTAGFIESSMDQQSVAELFSSSAGGDPAAMNNNWMRQFGENRVQLRGGAMIPLPLGAKVSPFIPGRPNQAFEQFMLAVLRHVAAGLNIPYELLTKDFSNTNYSSARAALLEAWRYFNGRRRWLTEHWLRPVYELWMEEAIDRGRVQAAGFYENKYAYLRCRFIFAGRGWVDPKKEIDAAKGRMESDITNLEIECAEQGLDWEEVLETKARINKRRVELGVPDQTLEPRMTLQEEIDSEADEKGEDTEAIAIDVPITDLGLTVRTESVLMKAGVMTILQLLQMTSANLLKISGFGKKSLEEIYSISYPTESAVNA